MVVEDKEDQEEDAGMLMLNPVHKVGLAMEKVGVKAKVRIDRRYKCHSRMNMPADLKNLEDSRKADFVGPPEEAEERYII